MKTPVTRRQIFTVPCFEPAVTLIVQCPSGTAVEASRRPRLDGTRPMRRQDSPMPPPFVQIAVYGDGLPDVSVAVIVAPTTGVAPFMTVIGRS